MSADNSHADVLGPTIRGMIDAGRMVERIVEQAVAPMRLATLLALDSIAADPGLTPSALARELGLEPQTIAGVLQRMDRDGLIERRPDPDDARKQRLFMSVAGLEDYERAGEAMTKHRANVERIIEANIGLAGVQYAIAEALQRYRDAQTTRA